MEEAAFEEAAVQYKDTVFRIALNYCRRPADADDITQNVLIRMLKCEKEFVDAQHLKCWVIRVAVNESKRWLVSPYRLFTLRSQSYEEALAEQFALEPEEVTLYASLARLPKKYRIALYLHYYEGYSVAEIGTLLHLGVSTVTTHLQRGRARLKTILSESEDSPAAWTQRGSGKGECKNE